MKPQPAPGVRRSTGRPRPASVRASGGRVRRTIVLATLAAVLAIYWLADQMALDRDELLGHAASSLLFVGVIVALGMVLGVLLWLIRRAGASRDRTPPQ